MKREADKTIIEELKKQMLGLQKNHLSDDLQQPLGLGKIESAFQGNVFPQAAVHELISISDESAAATNGFISVVLGKLMKEGGFCVWIGKRPPLFPPALKTFGIAPDRILFIDTKKTKDTLWALEEAFKCNALSAVVGEVTEFGFEESRRLQLAAEQSRVTGFIHRQQPKTENAVACVSRWKITPIASTVPQGMPGIGYPAWNVKLSKARYGKTGEWQVEWSSARLNYISNRRGVQEIIVPEVIREIA
jgi:protein ImuA